MNCKHCQSEVLSNYCPACGHAATLKRIDRQYIIDEIKHELHVERGMLYTIKSLALHPGKTIQSYLTESRSRLVKPIIFLILTSLVYSLLDQYFQIEAGLASTDLTTSATGVIIRWVQEHYGYSNIMMGLFIALWIKLLFRSNGYNRYEILVVLCFVMGMGMLIFSVFVILQGLTHANVMSIAGIAGIAYAVWAVGQFYNGKKMSVYLKALVAYMAGMITFWLIAYLAGTIIDAVNKP